MRYYSVGLALKCASLTKPTRDFYRLMGNHFGNKKRRFGTMPDYYADRLKRMLRLARDHEVVRDGNRILELGTGWMHWEALSLRLFFDVEGVLFDVWDYRQLEASKNHFLQPTPFLEGDYLGCTPGELSRAKSRLAEILTIRSFDELYEKYGFRFLVQP